MPGSARDSLTAWRAVRVQLTRKLQAKLRNWNAAQRNWEGHPKMYGPLTAGALVLWLNDDDTLDHAEIGTVLAYPASDPDTGEVHPSWAEVNWPDTGTDVTEIRHLVVVTEDDVR